MYLVLLCTEHGILVNSTQNIVISSEIHTPTADFLCGWHDLVCGRCNCFNLITSFLIKTLPDYIISIETSQRGSASGWQIKKALQENCSNRESMCTMLR